MSFPDDDLAHYSLEMADDASHAAIALGALIRSIASTLSALASKALDYALEAVADRLARHLLLRLGDDDAYRAVANIRRSVTAGRAARDAQRAQDVASPGGAA